jgi:hypothetical protein
MNKKTKYTIYGATIAAIVNGAMNVIKQSNAMNEKSNQKFDWQCLLIAMAKGAIAGAAGGFALGSIRDYLNTKEKPINTNLFLAAAINQNRLNKADHRYQRLNEKAEILTQILKDEFRDKLSCEPLRLGSTEKGTALKDQFDIDVCLSFKAKSFSSTEEMYEAVEYILSKHEGSELVARFRRQKKSIGVYTAIGENEYKIDILPNKLTSKRGNKTSGYLYVNNNSIFGKSSFTKTDVHALNSIRLTETQKKIIIVFKNWKSRKNLPLSSHLLQCLVLNAYKYNRNYIPKSFSQKLIMVAQYIFDHIETTNIRSIENTNNIITDIPGSEKNAIRQACQEIIEDYQYQSNSIVDHFCK